MAKGRRAAPEEIPAPDSRPAAPFSPAPNPGAVQESSICPFLASETASGVVAAAIPAVDQRNRCVALTVPTPQFPQQQHLVCLTAAHVDCPRFLRGVLLAGMPPAKPAREPISPAVIGASLVLVAAIAASIGFLAVRGGFDLPVAQSPPPRVAVIATASPTPEPSSTAQPTPVASASSAIPPSEEPSATPPSTPIATPVPTPRPTPTPAPRSNRYALLTQCPSTPNCWVYVIRAGDNLTSIANWFGVSYDRVLAMNPNLRRPIHAGDKLRIPTPTR